MNKYLNKRKIALITSWILVLFNFGLMFHFSGQPATQSRELSGNVKEFVVDTIERIAPNRATEINTRNLHRLIRKKAHFFLYLILGMLVINALKQSGIKSILIALLICILFAIFDETYQTFIPGRSGEIRDVLIDSLGALTGILIYVSGEKVYNKFIKINSM